MEKGRAVTQPMHDVGDTHDHGAKVTADNERRIRYVLIFAANRCVKRLSSNWMSISWRSSPTPKPGFSPRSGRSGELRGTVRDMTAKAGSAAIDEVSALPAFAMWSWADTVWACAPPSKGS